ncbi:putative periplasmic copper binding protein [Bradyrhizobium sp. ORS 285]|uniref:copper-binding protein n=1 Tax=Bradyrhizobium sp. ORS 285 TaxID=115808 RepID=UPI0002409A92|nr:copper-binding protein [Bradyrhizobium sp. ORS 285]CCD87547.1 putative periplasmic copper binding protein [Bradyrhizobium sp. ORS 285]SMX60662.1 putative periplasmic copper binding protein [Bradyrhizobium sp. ORS 285]
MKSLTTAAALVLALMTPAFAADTISGDVKKVDEAGGKITLHHGPAKSLGMDEAMTMVYRVKDAALLKGLKPGDKVKFEAVEEPSGYTVTKIEKGK